MTQFNQLHPKIQLLLITLQQRIPNVPMTLDVNLTESWLHRYYIGVGGYQYEVWNNCLDGEQGSWGYSLYGFKPF